MRRELVQHHTIQVKAMFFHVTEHFFDPHSGPIIVQGHVQAGQVIGRTPRLFLADFPISKQVDRIDLLRSQVASSQPDTLIGLMDETAECSPGTVIIEPKSGITLLTQNIEPMPMIQLAQDLQIAKFAVSNQENGCLAGDQGPHISQQSQVFMGAAVSKHMFDPGPSNRDGFFSIGQVNHQQLMPKANLGTIHNQTNFSLVAQLSFQSVSRNQCIPFPYSDGWISQ